MDRLIIKGIKQLHVFKPYFYNKMDELAKDLIKALDESDPHLQEGGVKRSRSWRCRPRSKCGLMLSSSIPKSSARSDDSESSLDNWSQQHMNFSTCSQQPTDSDDIKNIFDKKTPLRRETYCGESDSVNENHYPYREPKKRVKFKRRAIEPPSVLKREFSSLPSVTTFSPRYKRARNIRSQKLSRLKAPKLSKARNVSHFSSEMQGICKGFRSVATSSGKRKRCTHERSLECSGSDCKEFASSEGNSSRLSRASYQFGKIDFKSEINSSGVSSSGSDCELLTNDESREADDEHSDFYQDCDTRKVPSLWQDDKIVMDERQLVRLKERQIKSGHRRLGRHVVSGSIFDNLSCSSVIAEGNMFSAEKSLAKSTSNKKRKGMPISANSIHDFKTFSPDSTIPESEFGDQDLKKMDWKTGTVLYQSDERILSSVKSTIGLDRIVLPLTPFYRNTDQTSPPPPPPSPSSLDSVFMINDSS